MDWPTASVILGVLGTIATAIVKRPWRQPAQQPTNGRVWASAVDVAALQKEVEGLRREFDSFADRADKHFTGLYGKLEAMIAIRAVDQARGGK